MKICKRCSNEVSDDSKFCGICGGSEFVQQNTTKEKPNKNKVVLSVVLSVLFVVVTIGGFFVYNSYFKNDKKQSPVSSPEQTSENEQTTTSTANQHVDYYSNFDMVLSQYGMADLSEFSYCNNGQYVLNGDSVYGLLSAFEYDCNPDSENELITLSLLPAEQGGAYLSFEIFQNSGAISKISQTGISANDNADTAPILRSANEFSRVLAFIIDNKLCIIQDSYDYADGGNSSWLSDFFVYTINPTDVSLYRHYYCHTYGWNCSIGETENNVLYTYVPTDFAVAYDEWRNIKSAAYSEMISDVKSLGLETYFCNENELAEADYITAEKLYTDNFFDSDDAVLLATLDTTINRTSDQWTGVVKYMPSDYTSIRDKVEYN